MQHLNTHLKRQSGIGKLTGLVFGTIAVAILYSAYHIIPFYYYYYELQNQFEAHAKAANVYTNKQLREKLMYHINKMEIPIDKPEDLRIDRTADGTRISLAYTEIFYVSWQGKDYDLHKFDFIAQAESNQK